MMQKISDLRYVFVDLDGTLLRDDKKFTNLTRDTIQEFRKNSHIPFGIATGRALSSLLPLLKKKELLDVVDVIVANNGVDLYFPKSEQLIRRHMLDKDTMQEIIDFYEEDEDITVCFHNPDAVYAQKVTSRVTSIMELNQYSLCFHPNHDRGYEQAARVMLLFDENNWEVAKSKIDQIHIKGVRGMRSEKDIYEFVNENVSKAVGIKEYVESNQDELKHVLVIGDSINDIEMLEQCGMGIAMKNADEQVKKYADRISEFTNNEDGVAHILKSIYSYSESV